MILIANGFYGSNNEARPMMAIKGRIGAGVALALTGACLLAQNPPNKRLWVLQEPNTIVEYDAATFALRQTQKVPPEVFKSPQDLQINQRGQMLFLPAQVQEQSLVQENTGATFWFWDGASGGVAQRPVTKTTVASGKNTLVEAATPRCFSSADGSHLFWFENRMKTLTGDGVDISVNTTFRVWQTNLAGAEVQEIASAALPACQCDTGVCSESCPEAAYWVPEEGVSNFFLMTQWVPGQIQPRYDDSFLYTRSVAGRWSAKKLPDVVEQVLDFRSDGNEVEFIESVPDAGCCGWENESSDQTVLTKASKTIPLFDEFKRYQNQDYDVSFFTSNARLSPRGDSAGFTIMATQNPGTEIRLSDSGRPNPGELARIQKALTELPVVEAVRVEDPAKPAARIPHATLVGWINEQEILVVENDVLVAFNVASGARRTSQIKISKPSYGFLR
jgi:hypothetical protein